MAHRGSAVRALRAQGLGLWRVSLRRAGCTPKKSPKRTLENLPTMELAVESHRENHRNKHCEVWPGALPAVLQSSSTGAPELWWGCSAAGCEFHKGPCRARSLPGHLSPARGTAGCPPHLAGTLANELGGRFRCQCQWCMTSTGSTTTTPFFFMWACSSSAAHTSEYRPPQRSFHDLPPQLHNAQTNHFHAQLLKVV